MERNTIVCADVLDFLRGLPDECVNCVVTSPPYFGLRSYGIEEQIGLEESPQAYLSVMQEVFHEIQRVLRTDGTLWLNLGDTYTGGGRGGNPPLSAYWKQGTNTGSLIENRTNVVGLPSKSLIGIPWRVVFALQDDGWILRSDIIWHKPNPMPESVTDRPTKAHEYVFLLTKCASYWYDAEAIREAQETAGRSLFYGIDAPKGKTPTWGIDGSQSLRDKGRAPRLLNLAGRNRRSVWTIPEPKVRLRDDITPEQRTYVVSELIKRGLL